MNFSASMRLKYFNDHKRPGLTNANYALCKNGSSLSRLIYHSVSAILEFAIDCGMEEEELDREIKKAQEMISGIKVISTHVDE